MDLFSALARGVNTVPVKWGQVAPDKTFIDAPTTSRGVTCNSWNIIEHAFIPIERLLNFAA